MIKKDVHVIYNNVKFNISEITEKYLALLKESNYCESELKNFESKSVLIETKVKNIIDLYFAFLSLTNLEHDAIVNVQAMRLLKEKLNSLGIYNLENYDPCFEDEEVSLVFSINDAASFEFSLKYSLDNFKYALNYKYKEVLKQIKKQFNENETYKEYLNFINSKEYYDSYIARLLYSPIYFGENDENNSFFSVENSVYSFDQKIVSCEYNLSLDEIKFIKDSLKYKNRLVELKSKDQIPLLMVMIERLSDENTHEFSNDKITNIICQFSKLELVKKVKKDKHNPDFLYHDKIRLSKDKLEELMNKKHSLTQKMEIRLLKENDIDKLYKSLRTKNQKEAFYMAYYNLLDKEYLKKYLSEDEIMHNDLPFSTIPEVNINVLKLSDNKGLPPIRS